MTSPSFVVRLVNNMDTTYLYYNVIVSPKMARGCKRGGTGVICCRIDRPAKYIQDATYKVTFSFCSPKDNFSRKEAHAKLSDRMNSSKYVTVRLRERKPLREVMFYAMKKFLRGEGPNLSFKDNENQGIPQWLWASVVFDSFGKPLYVKAAPR